VVYVGLRVGGVEWSDSLCTLWSWPERDLCIGAK
jgi:hypothetical protein